MSVSYKGRQLHPDEWDASGMPAPAVDGASVPETVDSQTGAPVVVVRFACDDTTVTTAADMCTSMGVDLAKFQGTMAGLVSAGWLTLLSDGTYAATIPTPGAAE